ncbi:hypothetical protein D3C85_1501780 [compost metagenome]
MLDQGTGSKTLPGFLRAADDGCFLHALLRRAVRFGALALLVASARARSAHGNTVSCVGRGQQRNRGVVPAPDSSSHRSIVANGRARVDTAAHLANSADLRLATGDDGGVGQLFIFMACVALSVDRCLRRCSAAQGTQ